MKDDETRRLMQKIRDAGHEIVVTPEIKAEVEDFIGGPLPVPATVKEGPFPPDTVLVCLPIAPFEKLMFPTNLTCPCAWGCGRIIQYRPSGLGAAQKVCMYCASERPKDTN